MSKNNKLSKIFWPHRFTYLFKVFSFLFIIFLIFLYWKNILFDASESLYDWNDPPYTIWVIQNNLRHFRNFDFTNIYDTNALYPFKYSLTFAENFFFPSLLLLPLSFFVTNPIFQLNVLLVANHLLVFICAFLLVGLVAKNFWAKIIASFYLAFSPYLFVQLGHIHMTFYWPLLLSLYFLIKSEERRYLGAINRNVFIAGFLMGLQFTTTAYLGIMGLFIIAIYYLVNLIYNKQRSRIFKSALIFFSVFLVISSISIYGYLKSKNTYGGQRDIGEYILYSAHVTDYLFPNGNQSSLFYRLPILNKWRNLDHHYVGEKAAFLGIVPSLIVLLQILAISKNKGNSVIGLKLTKTTIFFVLLIMVGFVFSLGPRLSANGEYLHIPLPYHLIINNVPLITSLRALARWFFLVVLAATFFVSYGLDKIFIAVEKKYKVPDYLLGMLFLGLFIFEFYPKPLLGHKQIWWNSAYQFMKDELCVKKSVVLLEYPFIYRNSDADIIMDLQYKTKTLLASTQHNCTILSGWPSYEPKEFQRISHQLDANGIDIDDLDLLRKLGFDYLKLNKFALTNMEVQEITKFLDKIELKTVFQDSQASIYKL